MMRLLLIITALSCLVACESQPTAPSTDDTTTSTRVVTLDTTAEGYYRLFVDGEPFYVKGAGCEFGDIAALAEHGANAFRTWRTDNGEQTAQEVLDEAQKYGLLVMMGIEVGRERHGYDYNDTAWVNSQKERIRQEVEAIKDHPALLGWGVGNELNLDATNLKVWDAVDDIAKMIDEIDGKHVTTTMLAGIDERNASYITANCPNLDFISIQMYGDIINLQQRIEEAGYEGPYLVTEWGATGHWEMPATEWGRPIEQTSSEKAASIKKRYEEAIQVDKKNGMGSFVFLWGQKQERTPTWYGLFTEQGEETPAIDVMHYFWNGEWPANRAPEVTNPQLNGQSAYDNVKLTPGTSATVTFSATDPDADTLAVRAEVMGEPEELSQGGDFEQRPATLEGLVQESRLGEVIFQAPEAPGAYRVFVYVTDGHNHAATFNIPFLVQ